MLNDLMAKLSQTRAGLMAQGMIDEANQAFAFAATPIDAWKQINGQPVRPEISAPPIEPQE
jgi:hypothetical protein